MNKLPIDPLSPEEQRKRMEQLYLLMGKQVRSYHKHRHMGSNSSVPVELAQELMESILYTVNLAGGVYAHENMEQALRLGQEILDSRLANAKSLLELVDATVPQWQTECRWEAIQFLRRYLECYDGLHLAHQAPDGLFYPILISPPEGIRGIDSCLFYLNIMWIENQIMAGVPDDALEQFWDHLPAATLNQCEPLLIHGIGKALLEAGVGSLLFDPEEQERLITALRCTNEEKWKNAVSRLCRWLDLSGEDAKQYVDAAAHQLALWAEACTDTETLRNLFIFRS